MPRITSIAGLAAAVFVLAFAIYALTAPPALKAYEPETAAVAEGFARTGDFQLIRDSPLAKDRGFVKKDGKRIGRVGFPQPVLEAPFYYVGWALDGVSSDSDTYAYRKWVFLFYNPFVMALVAALVFLIMVRIHGSVGWAITVAALFTVASNAWPMSKLGLDVTATLGIALAFLGAVAARDSARLWPWLAVGFGGGLAVAAKQYELPAVAAMGVLLWPALRSDAGQRVGRLACLAMPFLLWMAGMAWYNWTRTGSVTDTGNSEYSQTLAAPLNAIGFLVSPGKGLLLYSPLAILGLIGLVALWRQDRRLGLTIALVFGLGLAFVAVTPNWTDETWGPRYLMPVSWLLLLPLPWFAATMTRRRVLGAVAAVAVCIQLVAVLVPYDQIVKSIPALTGEPLFQQRGKGIHHPDVALGRDSMRWVPQLSPLLIQTELVASRIGQEVGLPPITVRYAPFEGRDRELVLSKRFAAQVGFTRPDFWWAQPDAGARAWVGGLAALVAALASAALLASVATGRFSRRREPSPV